MPKTVQGMYIILLLEIMNLHKTLITGKQQCSSLDKKFATNICNMPVFIHSKFAENHLVYSLISRRQPTRVKSIVYELKAGKLENNEKRPVADKYQFEKRENGGKTYCSGESFKICSSITNHNQAKKEKVEVRAIFKWLSKEITLLRLLQ